MADALSQREEEGVCQAIIVMVPDWVRDLTDSYAKLEWIKALQAQLTIKANNA